MTDATRQWLYEVKARCGKAGTGASMMEIIENTEPFQASARTDIPRLLELVERLSEHIEWLTQTVHQAHHAGERAECGKSTCRGFNRVWEQSRVWAHKYGGPEDEKRRECFPCGRASRFSCARNNNDWRLQLHLSMVRTGKQTVQ